MNTNITDIDADRLKQLLDGPERPVLIDVRLAEEFSASHLPGALNNCVFEVVFSERINDIAPDKAASVCLYGSQRGSLESRMAAEKLIRAGYARVYDFTDGIAGWKSAGFATKGDTSPATVTQAIPDGVRSIDLKESRIKWIGRNLLNHHEGLIALKSGWLKLEDGVLREGGFVIDMQSITCLDLAENSLHDVLIRHLLDHDFFDSARYPEASFQITGSEAIAGATPGAPDMKISGILTLKGIAKPLDFTACTGITDAGQPAAQATLVFDRTLWNVLYGSGKWFSHPGGHLVNDLIELQVRIVGSLEAGE